MLVIKFIVLSMLQKPIFNTVFRGSLTIYGKAHRMFILSSDNMSRTP